MSGINLLKCCCGEEPPPPTCECHNDPSIQVICRYDKVQYEFQCRDLDECDPPRTVYHTVQEMPNEQCFWVDGDFGEDPYNVCGDNYFFYYLPTNNFPAWSYSFNSVQLLGEEFDGCQFALEGEGGPGGVVVKVEFWVGQLPAGGGVDCDTDHFWWRRDPWGYSWYSLLQPPPGLCIIEDMEPEISLIQNGNNVYISAEGYVGRVKTYMNYIYQEGGWVFVCPVIRILCC